MAHLRWVDSNGHPFPTRPCLRFSRPTPIFRMTLKDMRRNGRIPFPSWCIGAGMDKEVLPIPAKDGKCDLVPVIGEAW